MKVLFCGYRDWAEDVFDDIAQWGRPHNKITQIEFVANPVSMEKLARETEWDVIILAGWSWKVPEDIVNSRLVIGMHPSDLPEYAGGSPIQHQILDGIEETKATLFKLNAEFDKGEIIDKEPLYLYGHLDTVVMNIAIATTKLLIRFLENFPNYTLTPQNHKKGTTKRRLKPEHSRLPIPLDNSGESLTCKEMWNFIRCREDPYPNAYFEDETGKLVITRVEFYPNDKTKP